MTGPTGAQSQKTNGWRDQEVKDVNGERPEKGGTKRHEMEKTKTDDEVRQGVDIRRRLETGNNSSDPGQETGCDIEGDN